MTDRYKELFNINNKPAPLPKIPKHYGVSTKPVKKAISILAATSIVIVATSIVFNSYSLLLLLLLVIISVCYVVIAQKNRVDHYKNQYFLTKLGPWFKENFGYSLHPFDLNRFMEGLGVIAENKPEAYNFVYILPRYDEEKDQIFVSYVDGAEELKELYSSSLVRPSYPRVSPNLVTKKSEGLLPENAYFKTFETHTKSGNIIVAYSSVQDKSNNF